MESRHAVYAGVCAAVIAFAAAFILAELTPVPLPWYYPLERRWALEAQPDGLAMGWYGRTLFASAVSALGYLGVWASSRRRRLLGRGAAAWAAAAALAVALTVTLSAWRLSGREVEPAPLPEWYVPR